MLPGVQEMGIFHTASVEIPFGFVFSEITYQTTEKKQNKTRFSGTTFSCARNYLHNFWELHTLKREKALSSVLSVRRITAVEATGFSRMLWFWKIWVHPLLLNWSFREGGWVQLGTASNLLWHYAEKEKKKLTRYWMEIATMCRVFTGGFYHSIEFPFIPIHPPKLCVRNSSRPLNQISLSWRKL